MRRPNGFFITAIVILVVIEVLILRPSNVEFNENEVPRMHTSIEAQIQAQQFRDEIKYIMSGVRYTVVERGHKQWLMTAREALSYDKNNLIVADDVDMKMYDGLDKMTLIEADKAHFKIGQRELDLSGNLRITFPDNFWLKTEKGHYSAADQTFSGQEPFYGESRERTDELKVWGVGFLGSRMTPDLHVLRNVRVQTKTPDSKEVSDVHSDYAKIDRVAKTGDFSMKAGDRSVETIQGTLNVRSKRQRVVYDADKRNLKTMVAEEDVIIREIDEKKSVEGLKYATCQKADFFAQENKIVLSGFPSVYQDNDTVTGELITIYRDKNIIEVNEANAYHEGSN